MKRLIMFLILVVCLIGFLFAQEVVDEPATREEVDAEAIETDISVEDSTVQEEVVPEKEVGLPLKIDLRFTQLFFVMGDVEDQNGNPLENPYSHAENGILFGVSYTLPF